MLGSQEVLKYCKLMSCNAIIKVLRLKQLGAHETAQQDVSRSKASLYTKLT